MAIWSIKLAGNLKSGYRCTVSRTDELGTYSWTAKDGHMVGALWLATDMARAARKDGF